MVVDEQTDMSGATPEPTEEAAARAVSVDDSAQDDKPQQIGQVDEQSSDESAGAVESERPETVTDDVAVADADADADDDDDDDDEQGESGHVEPIEEITEAVDEDAPRDWYILKVQSNREESIRDGLQRRVAVAGMDRFFGDIIVPTEDVAEFKNGKKRISKRKLYPGYIVVNMSINDDTWFLVRETPGIGDFTGSAGKPTPMLPQEVDRIVQSSKPEDEGGEPVKTAIPFKFGDRVRIKEGTFENFEGDVDGIDEANGRVTVMINIFGRSTPVELEHWQIESV